MGNVIRQVDLCEHSDRAKNDPKEVSNPTVNNIYVLRSEN